MSSPNWFVVFSQLAGQAPTLLVYLIGVVMCAVWWRRSPRAAMLAMIGCGMLLLTSVGVSFVQVYYISNRSMSASSIGSIMTFVALVASVLRAGGFVLLLCAVFVERPRVADTGFEVQQYPPPLRS